MLNINRAITNCKKCSRLVDHRENVNIPTQPKKLRGTPYWSKAVPGFGDLKASILIVGLAPGLHGANRTGRPFTGDGAGILLYKSLYEMGWGTRPDVISIDDGLKLTNVYISNIVKCVPPQNVPNGEEKNNCRSFLTEEMSKLKNLKTILALGATAHQELLKIFRDKDSTIKMKDYPFKHGHTYQIKNTPYLLTDCYHPSTYNVNTGVINLNMMLNVFTGLKENLI